MGTMTETGTEKRLDELSKRVDHGFERVDADIREVRSDIKAVRTEMKGGFEAVDAKFDSFHRTLILLLGGALSTLVGGLIAAAFTALS
jgi:hypothetical protein